MLVLMLVFMLVFMLVLSRMGAVGGRLFVGGEACHCCGG